MLLSEGQMSDYKGAALMLDALPPAKALLGDRGYDAGWFRDALAARGITAGFEPLDPWDVSADIAEVFALPKGDARRGAELPGVNRRVGELNSEMIRACGGVLAVLDGSDVDSGTAAEIGYAAALARPVVGLRSDLRNSGDNEATLVNLQVEWFILESGGRLHTSLPDAIAALAELMDR